jgi:uncharacterized membrane protein
MRIFSSSTVHRLTLVCCAVLLLLFLLPVLVTNGSVGLWLMQTIPLLIVLPGLVHHKPRSLQWLGFLVLFYLLQAILQLFSPMWFTCLIGIFSTLLCILLFTAVIVTLKTPNRHATKDQ